MSDRIASAVREQRALFSGLLTFSLLLLHLRLKHIITGMDDTQIHEAVYLLERGGSLPSHFSPAVTVVKVIWMWLPGGNNPSWETAAC